MSGKILIADDEKGLVSMMKAYFELSGYQVLTACGGNEALKKAACCPDIILLDINMPDMDGFTVCQRIREHISCPILFLTARVETGDKIKGFTSGTDDYIVKPFPLSVLSQKCMAIIRRSKRVDQEHRLTGKGIVIDLIRKQVYVEGEEVSFSSKDFRLLAYLMENRDVVLEREIILSRIWGYDFEGDTRVVDTHIKRIRKLLGDHADCIKTVIGSGYVYREE